MSAPLLALYAGVRGLIYLSLLLMIGGQVAVRLVRSALSDHGELARSIRDRAAKLSRQIVPVFICLVVARGALQVLSFHEPGDAIDAGLMQGVLVGTSWGSAWLLQLAAALVLTCVVNFSAPAAARTSSWITIILAVIVWAQSGMGHAATNKWMAPLGRLLDSVHLTGAGIWIGTLGVLALVALPSLRTDERLTALAMVVRSFSVFARAGVTLVMVSGVIAALVYAGSLQLLFDATWGRLLLVKVTIMIGVLALGWYNWKVVTPALDGADAGARAKLRTAIRLELLLALAMLAITTMLVASPLPGES